jgi:hypothetical protein
MAVGRALLSRAARRGAAALGRWWTARRRALRPKS